MVANLLSFSPLGLFDLTGFLRIQALAAARSASFLRSFYKKTD